MLMITSWAPMAGGLGYLVSERLDVAHMPSAATLSRCHAHKVTCPASTIRGSFLRKIPETLRTPPKLLASRMRYTQCLANLDYIPTGYPREKTKTRKRNKALNAPLRYRKIITKVIPKIPQCQMLPMYLSKKNTPFCCSPQTARKHTMGQITTKRSNQK